MALDQSTPRTRRTVLAGSVGALAVLAADAIARPLAADAASYVVLAGDNEATGTTFINNSSGGGLSVGGTGSNALGIGLHASSDGSSGVFGLSGTASGVEGHSDSLNGMYGHTNSATASGVYGENPHRGYGVAGRSNAGPLAAGVGAAGTLGDNTANGIGVWARSAHGIGLYAEAVGPDAVSLKTNGIAQFARSGVLTVAAGTRSVRKTGIRVDPRTVVLAVLQQFRAGVYVAAAVPNAAGDSFTITLNKVVTKSIKVGWFLVKPTAASACARWPGGSGRSARGGCRSRRRVDRRPAGP